MRLTSNFQPQRFEVEALVEQCEIFQDIQNLFSIFNICKYQLGVSVAHWKHTGFQSNLGSKPNEKEKIPFLFLFVIS